MGKRANILCNHVQYFKRLQKDSKAYCADMFVLALLAAINIGSLVETAHGKKKYLLHLVGLAIHHFYDAKIIILA